MIGGLQKSRDLRPAPDEMNVCVCMGVFNRLSGFTVTIGAFGRLDGKYNVPDYANDGNEADENPPSALADVVHTAHSNGDRRNEVGNREDVAQPVTDTTENESSNQCVKDHIPILCTGGSGIKVSVLVVEELDSFGESYIHNSFGLGLYCISQK